MLPKDILFFFLINLFIYLFICLFMAVLGPRFCARAFSSCGERGPLIIAVHGPLTVAEHRLQTCRLSSCGSWAQLLSGMWDPPQTRARTRVPCIGRQILNHCATREAPKDILKQDSMLILRNGMTLIDLKRSPNFTSN